MIMKRIRKKMLCFTLAAAMLMGVMGGCSSSSGEASSASSGDSSEKQAMLVVSFGTSYADTRALTIDKVEEQFKEKFASYDIYRAFTSQTIIDILKERDNIQVYNVKEAMEELKKQKYSKVVIQNLLIMNGAEYDEFVAQIEPFKDDFKEISIGKALLTSHDDYTKTVEAMKSQLPEMAEGEAVVFMGHGTHHHANAVYPALEYSFHDVGLKNVFVGTVEGFPAFEDVVERLEENNINKVTLMPFMLVAGDHANNDMAGDEEDSWKTMLKEKGFEVDTYIHGLGENQGIRDIYMEHAEAAIENEGSEQGAE